MGLWYLPDSSGTLAIAIMYAVFVIQIPLISVGFSFLLPIVQSFFVNITPLDRQGLVQGTTQSLATIQRSLGPVIIGALFTLLMGLQASWIVSLFMSATFFVTLVMSYWLPHSIEHPQQSIPEAGTESESDFGDIDHIIEIEFHSDLEEDICEEEEMMVNKES